MRGLNLGCAVWGTLKFRGQLFLNKKNIILLVGVNHYTLGKWSMIGFSLEVRHCFKLLCISRYLVFKFSKA